MTDWRGDAAVLRRNGHGAQAQMIEAMADEASVAAHDYLQFLPEDDASLYSGKSPEWLRSRFPGWEVLGHGKKIGRRRYYRTVVLPRRADPVQEYRQGRASAA